MENNYKDKETVIERVYPLRLYPFKGVPTDGEEVHETGTSNSQDIEITSDGTVGLPRNLIERLNLF